MHQMGKSHASVILLITFVILYSLQPLIGFFFLGNIHNPLCKLDWIAFWGGGDPSFALEIVVCLKESHLWDLAVLRTLLTMQGIPSLPGNLAFRYLSSFYSLVDFQTILGLFFFFLACDCFHKQGYKGIFFSKNQVPPLFFTHRNNFF